MNDNPDELDGAQLQLDEMTYAARCLWDALADLVGSRDEQVLTQMLNTIDKLPGADENKSVSVTAIKALLEHRKAVSR